jgi:2-deoxy-D-gluconate 3-dehydrogenase
MNTIMDKFNLTGKVAIVTGGPGLLGKEFCRTLAEALLSSQISTQMVSMLLPLH